MPVAPQILMQVAGRDIGQLTDFEAMAVISEPARGRAAWVRG
jgi:hypothetical protein